MASLLCIVEQLGVICERTLIAGNAVQSSTAMRNANELTGQHTKSSAKKLEQFQLTKAPNLLRKKNLAK